MSAYTALDGPPHPAKSHPSRRGWWALAKERGLQQCSRVPPLQVGDWVLIGTDYLLGPDLAGKVREVKSLTASRSKPGQKDITWHVHLTDGRSVLWEHIDRMATAAEIERAKRGQR